VGIWHVSWSWSWFDLPSPYQPPWLNREFFETAVMELRTRSRNSKLRPGFTSAMMSITRMRRWRRNCSPAARATTCRAFGDDPAYDGVCECPPRCQPREQRTREAIPWRCLRAGVSGVLADRALGTPLAPSHIPSPVSGGEGRGGWTGLAARRYFAATGNSSAYISGSTVWRQVSWRGKIFSIARAE
jgi:hypothetical protein